MLRIYWLSVFFLASFIELSTSEIALSGLNVRPAKKSEFPFVVSLSYDNPDTTVSPGKNHFCGGALISEKHVLTVAHCFNQFTYFYEVVVKINGDLSESKIHTIRKWTTYDRWAKKKFNSAIVNDIAIVELTKKVKDIKPAELSCIPEAQLDGKKVSITGWGFLENHQTSRQFSTAELTIVHANKCIRNLAHDVNDKINSTTHTFICSIAEPIVYTSRGDSGSPVLINHNEIVAVHKSECTIEKYGRVVEYQNAHVSIDHYREFINEVLNCKDAKCCIQ